jgi:acyl carrier protein
LTEDGRLYATGDIARWMPDGNIEFLGRLDRQVKIRGFRVELGEIENQLLKNTEINDVVVIAKEDKPGNKYLCAYLVSDVAIETARLKPELSKYLPQYLIPSYFVQMEKLPLNKNGKVDRRALPEPKFEELEEYIAPANEIEKKLAAIYLEILPIEKNSISTESEFFELGGNSLTAMLLISKLGKELNITVPLVEFFGRSTIRKLAEYIKTASKGRFVSISPTEKKEYYPLSSVQKRLYLIQQQDLEGTAYNIPMMTRLEGTLDIEKLRNAFKKSMGRHESLRTSFQLIDGEPVQRIQLHDRVNFELEYYDCTLEGTEINGQIPEVDIVGNFVRSFDLNKAPLLRAGLIKTAQQGWILMVDMHHIVTDGFSMGILIKEFIMLYNGSRLPELKLQYRDFSQWQSSEKQQKVIKKQEEYWLKQFSEKVPALNLPQDYEKPAVLRHEGGMVYFELDREKTGGLKTLAHEGDVTLFILLLTLYYVFLSKISGGQEDIVVGTGVMGRTHADLQPIIGMFVNTLALRNFPTGEKSFMIFLKEVKERAVEAFENQDYPFEELVNNIVHSQVQGEVQEENGGKNPLIDTVFLMNNTDVILDGLPAVDVEMAGVKLAPYQYENRTSQFDLTLNAREGQNTITAAFEYNSTLFKRATVEAFAIYFENIVSSVLNNPYERLKKIDIIPENEKITILSQIKENEQNEPIEFDI